MYLFSDPATDVMEALVKFHDNIMFYLIIIVTFVTWFVLSSIYHDFIVMRVLGNLTVHQINKPLTRSIQDSLTETLSARVQVLQTRNITALPLLEIIWTIIPIIILLFIAVPSFSLLYFLEETIAPALTVKIIAHQWYWQYEYSDYEQDYTFDSYMVPEEDLLPGQPRLLQVDAYLWLPTYVNIRLLMTSSDVLHSWAVPSLGIKMDCLPGRLNQVPLMLKREGLFFGQCSELCGVNHGFMPIGVKAVSLKLFNHWVGTNMDSDPNLLLTAIERKVPAFLKPRDPNVLTPFERFSVTFYTLLTTERGHHLLFVGAFFVGIMVYDFAFASVKLFPFHGF